jgi:GMP synthase (glutamine-hydrolysing) B subunit
VVHTPHGRAVLANFVFGIAKLKTGWSMKGFVRGAVKQVREQVGDGRVLCGLSGGVDSTVAATLIHRAIGDRLTCVLVDHGLLRKDEAAEVERELGQRRHLNLRVVNARARFLGKLAGVSDPERKRKIIGEEFVAVFDEEAQRIGRMDFLAQGTLYPDVIESASAGFGSQVIKSHHNVGGLPEHMRMKLVEPLKMLFKDEVRALGRELGLPAHLVDRHPFPGPGLAVRILSDIREEDLDVLREADAIFIEELRRAKWYGRTLAGVRRAAAGLDRGREGRRAFVRARRGAARGQFGGWHDRRLDAHPARAAGARRKPHRQRGARGEPRGLRHHQQAAGDDRVGMKRALAQAAAVSLLGGSIRVRRTAQWHGSAALPRLTATPSGVHWQGAALGGRPEGRAAPIARWWDAARDTGLAGTAVLVPLADSLIARGDTLRADSLLAAPAARALAMGVGGAAEACGLGVGERGGVAGRTAAGRGLADALALVRGGRVARRSSADSPPAARHHVGRGARAQRARGPRERGSRLGHGTVTARDALEASRRTFALPLERRAAVAEWANGRRADALARNAQVLRRTPAAERAPDLIQRIQWYRDWRRPMASLAVSDTALRLTRGTPEFERVRLERARSFRAQGKPDSALLLYQRVGRAAADGAMRATAWWECAREAQDESRWELASKAFRHADSLSRKYRDAGASLQQSATLAGLMDWMLGRQDDAIAAWRESGDRRARFWLGVALRRRGLVEGDSILRAEFALRPGFDLYNVAARDTLGLPSGLGQVAVPQPDSLEPQLVAAIVALSGPLQLPDAAARIVSARDRKDARLAPGPRGGIATSSWRAITLASYAGGDLAGATRAADRALNSAANDSSAWEWVPWAFPPAYEREVVAAGRCDGRRTSTALGTDTAGEPVRPAGGLEQQRAGPGATVAGHGARGGARAQGEVAGGLPDVRARPVPALRSALPEKAAQAFRCGRARGAHRLQRGPGQRARRLACHRRAGRLDALLRDGRQRRHAGLRAAHPRLPPGVPRAEAHERSRELT